jgi:hypothetical protein
MSGKARYCGGPKKQPDTGSPDYFPVVARRQTQIIAVESSGSWVTCKPVENTRRRRSFPKGVASAH